MSTALQRLWVEVAATAPEADDIRSYVLVDPGGGDLPPFAPGAHVGLYLPSGRVRQYSLANDPAESGRYLIAVQREANGRGGSVEVQQTLRPGARLQITAPLNNFPLSASAHRHLLIAGGIGITPMMAMLRRLQREGADWALHYCARAPEKAAFREFLATPPYAGRVQFHFDGGDPAKGLNIAGLLAEEDAAGTHAYCCGPRGLMEAVRAAGAGWPAGRLHFEYFAADDASTEARGATSADAPFEVRLARSGEVLAVPSGVSILTVLERHGLDVPSLCAEGVCGTCLVDVVEGTPDHRDYVLDDEERAANRRIAVCCSRSLSPRLTLDL